MKDTDVSFRSMSRLEKQFAKRVGQPPWVPDWAIEPPSSTPAPREALLMGSYFERVFQPRFWPAEEFTLYCLCTKVLRVLEEVFGFAPGSVGMLSRYSLFPVVEEPRELKLGDDTIFYYGGRLSPQKNLEFLILTAFYAQIHVSERIRLALIGNWDNEYHKNIRGCRYTDYQKKIESLLDSLPWPGERPRFQVGQGPEAWKQFIPADGVHLSASTLISEDFSVVAAELQERGEPQILPDWGGFSDVCGENIQFYPSERIGTSHDTLDAIGKKAEAFVRELLFNPVALRAAPPLGEAKDSHPTVKLSRRALEQNVGRNRRAWGAEIDLVERGELSRFVATETGQRMFAKISEIFDGPGSPRS